LQRLGLPLERRPPHFFPTLTVDGRQTPSPLQTLFRKQGFEDGGAHFFPPGRKVQSARQHLETPRSSHCSPPLTTPSPQSPVPEPVCDGLSDSVEEAEPDEVIEAPAAAAEAETEAPPAAGEAETEAPPAAGEAETEAPAAAGEAETEALPAAAAEAETETFPAAAEAETETLPAAAEAETETLPATEAESETFPATEGESEMLGATSEIERVPLKNDCEIEIDDELF